VTRRLHYPWRRSQKRLLGPVILLQVVHHLAHSHVKPIKMSWFPTPIWMASLSRSQVCQLMMALPETAMANSGLRVKR
jgi:hypothetical protein